MCSVSLSCPENKLGHNMPRMFLIGVTILSEYISFILKGAPNILTFNHLQTFKMLSANCIDDFAKLLSVISIDYNGHNRGCNHPYR